MRCLTSVGTRTRRGAFDRRARGSWPIAKYWEYGSLGASDRCAGLFSDKASKTGLCRTSPDGRSPPFFWLTGVAAARMVLVRYVGISAIPHGKVSRASGPVVL